MGAGAPAACEPVWGGGGGSRRCLPAPPLGGGRRFPILAPLFSSAHSPPACAFGFGRGAAQGGGNEGRPVDRSPGGPFRPEPSLCPPRVGNGHGGGHAGRGPHTVLVRRRVPPPGLVRAPLRRAGVGSPVGLDPCGSRRLKAPGRAVCNSSRIPHPASQSLWGRGGVPSALGGRRVAPVALKLGGGSGGGGGGAPPPPAPPPCRASACHLLSRARPPRVYSCRGGCRAAVGVGRGPVGRHWVSGAGGGGRGGEPLPPWFAPWPSPGRPLKGLLRLRRPGRRRSAVGQQRAGQERAGGSPGALAAAAVPPHPGCSGLFGGGAGPPSLWSASVRSWA